MNTVPTLPAPLYLCCTPSARCGFKICEMSTHSPGAKDICGTMWLFLMSTHLVHPCTPHQVGTPLGNSGAPWGVRYTWLTSTALDESISCRFSLETRLGSESFELLIDVIAILIHKVWFENTQLLCNVYKATAVTHTKRIDCNFLREETSFVYYTPSVLRKSRHMKQKE